MDADKLRSLRKRQFIYMNLLFVIYGIILFALLFSEVANSVFYLAFSLVFFLAPIGYFAVKHAEPLMLFFPGMKELYKYEQEKLKDYWNRYQASTAILHTFAGTFLLIQAWNADHVPIIKSVPSWYLIAIPLFLLYIGNVNQRFHNKRIDQRTFEQLKEYIDDRLLFIKVFGVVALVVMLLWVLVLKIFSLV
jgi:hypothetical protein